MERKLYIINFGHELNPDVLKEIQETYKVETEEIHIAVNINLKKSIYIQCVDIVDKIPADLMKGYSKIVINPPGLPNAALCLLTEIHARTGYFPLLLELYRDKTEDPLFNDFKLRRLIDLERERQVSRSKKYEGKTN